MDRTKSAFHNDLAFAKKAAKYAKKKSVSAKAQMKEYVGRKASLSPKVDGIDDGAELSMPRGGADAPEEDANLLPRTVEILPSVPSKSTSNAIRSGK